MRAAANKCWSRIVGQQIVEVSWLLQNSPARPGCHGAPRRRMFRRLAAAQRGAMFAPSLCAAKGRPGARQGRVFGRLAAPRRRRGCAFSAPPRGGGGGLGAVFNPTAPTNPKYGVGSVEGAFPRHRGVMAARWFPSPVVGVRSPAGPLCRSARVCVAQLGALFAKCLL